MDISRVLIVGHSDLVRNGLEHILARFSEFEVAISAKLPLSPPGPLASAEGGNSSARPVPAVLAARDDLDILDGADVAEALGLPGLEAPAGRTVILFGMPAAHLDTYAWISALSEVGHVLIVGEAAQEPELTGTIRAGALGWVPWNVDEEELLRAVRTVARGGMHISPSLSGLLLSELREPQAAPPTVLAPREIETLGWLAAGLTHREIATRMGLTEATVSTYVKRIRGKLNARNKAELTRLAIELGFLELGKPADQFSFAEN